MTTVRVPQITRRPLQTKQVVRNGLYPSSVVQTRVAEDTNQILRYRTRCVGSFAKNFDNIGTNTGSSQEEFWFAFHSSSHIRYLKALFYCAMTGDSGATDPYAMLTVRDGDNNVVGTAEFHFGRPDITAIDDDVTRNFGHGTAVVSSDGQPVQLDPNTDYFGIFTTEDYGRIVAAAVYEENLDSDSDNGYVEPGTSTLGPIASADRGDIIPLLRTAWKRNGSHLWNHHGGVTNTSTYVNAISAHTTNTSASAGVKIDLSHCSTIRRVTVPAKWYVYAKMSAISGGSGYVKLLDDDVLAAEIEIDSTTPAWYSTTVNLAASDRKYDIHVKGNAGGVEFLHLYGGSLFSYEE